MKIVVVYYSFEGNVKFIAESIASVINADTLELKLKEEIKSKGFMKYLWGGKQVVTQKEPELLPLDKNPKEYDLIIIGTPVWAWTFAPALRSFFSKIKLENKKIALFCCHGGQKGKTFVNMKSLLGENMFLGEFDIEEPLKTDKIQVLDKVSKWVNDISKKCV